MRAGLPTPAEVERALEEVYARPEFREREVLPFLQWLSDRWSAAKSAFWEAVGGVRLLEATAPVLYWAVVIGLALVALAILFHFGGAWHRAWRVRERQGAARERAEGGVRPPGAAEWEAEARRAAAAGRLREAALALYQALLLRLDARGAVRYDPSKTPGEYRWEAMGNAEVARVLEGFLRGFEPVAFGGRALDAAGYDRLRSIAAEGGAHG